MQKPRFKYGDRVIVSRHTGKVKSIRKEDGRYYCTVVFDNPALMPSELEYEERHLKFENKFENECPKCGSEWKVTKFNVKSWKDCEKCGKTQEELVKEDYEKSKLKVDFGGKTKKPGSYSKKEDELLEEFERILNGDDDDESDPDNDFFLFGI
jgi:hypothetical protein